MPQEKPKTVYLRFESSEDDRVERVKALLRLFAGAVPVNFYYQDTKQQVRVPQSMFADDGDYLRNRLTELLGEKNVVYK